MPKLFRSKLLLPAQAEALPRPRLSDTGPPPRVTVVQAPPGAGKSLFLAQWLPAAGLPYIYYRLDQQDRDGGPLPAHLSAGFQRVWPDWQPPQDDLQEFAADLAGEAAVRPPVILALDGLEVAFGQPWLADFLTLLLRYAPPALHLVLATRAPLPVEPGAGARCLRAADLAFTRAEAEALLGPAGWEDCWSKTGGFPLALALWRQHGSAWRTALTARLLPAMPPHLPPEIAASLVNEWLAGNLSLDAFAHRVSVGQPGTEQLWTELKEIHWQHCDHPPGARERATTLWETARGRGDRSLMAATAMLLGDISMGLGDYALASEWFRQAFELDPMLELTGAHGKVTLLRDQGRLEEAESLASRCLEARQGMSDLTALANAHLTYGMLALDCGRLDEAEMHLLEAEQYYHKYAANEPIRLTAVCQRALLEATRGNMSGFRRLAEEAYGLARGRFRFLEACTGMVLAAALVAWGDRSSAERLLASSWAYHSSIGAKFYMHSLLVIFARKAWAEGKPDEARRFFDQALGLAAAQGFVQHLCAPRTASLPLIADALGRGVEAHFCQELLIRIGDRALPLLLEMTRAPEGRVRQAAPYPLAAIGGEAAAAAVRALLHDAEPPVRDAALLAYQALVREESPPPAPASPATTAGLAISILGHLSVQVGGRPLAKWRTTKARDLLAYLVLAGGRPVTRDQAMEALWPDTDFDSAKTLLHTTLYNLRNSLGAAGDGLITFAGGAYRMNREGVEVDLDRFERLAAAPDEAAWREASDLYRGDLLDGLDYPWCDGPRTHARQTYQALLRRLAEECRAERRHAEAADVLQLLVQLDPLDEEAHLGLMEVYAAQGNRAAALQQYRTIARLLDDELGLEPSASTQALYRKLLD